MNNQVPLYCLTRKKFPDSNSFTCFEDDDLKIDASFTFGSNLMVQSIDFKCTNNNGTKFQIKDIKYCDTSLNQQQEKNFKYRVLLIDDGTNDVFTFQVDPSDNLDLREHVETHFFFNVISSSDINSYLGNCNFNPNKPKTKDGYIIISVR